MFIELLRPHEAGDCYHEKNEPARVSIMVWEVLNIWISEIARTIGYTDPILLRAAPLIGM
jgi:hypothetical protein